MKNSRLGLPLDGLLAHRLTLDLEEFNNAA
jgi:hypothetical protein